MTDSLIQFAVTAFMAVLGCFICGSIIHLLLNEIMSLDVSLGACMLFGSAIGVATYKTMPQ